MYHIILIQEKKVRFSQHTAYSFLDKSGGNFHVGLPTKTATAEVSVEHT